MNVTGPRGGDRRQVGRKLISPPKRGTAMHAMLALTGIGLATLFSFALALLLETMALDVVFWGMRRSLHRASSTQRRNVNDHKNSLESHQQEVACLPG